MTAKKKKEEQLHNKHTDNLSTSYHQFRKNGREEAPTTNTDRNNYNTYSRDSAVSGTCTPLTNNVHREARDWTDTVTYFGRITAARAGRLCHHQGGGSSRQNLGHGFPTLSQPELEEWANCPTTSAADNHGNDTVFFFFFSLGSSLLPALTH